MRTQVKALAVSTVVTGALGAVAITGLKHGGLGARDMADIATWRGAMQAGQYHRVRQCADLPNPHASASWPQHVSLTLSNHALMESTHDLACLTLQTGGIIIRLMTFMRKMCGSETARLDLHATGRMACANLGSNKYAGSH